MENKLPVLINELSPATIEANFNDMEARSNRAVQALKAVTSIATDEQDEKAEQLLVKVRKTFEHVEKVRKAITGPIDDIKKLLMEPEKQITNAAGSGNEYERVKKLRDEYANLKFQQEKERQEAIEKQRKVSAEIARVKGVVKTNYTEGIVKANMTLNSKLSDAFKSVTSQTFLKLKDRMGLGTKLSEQTYNEWFDAGSISSTLPFIEVKQICDDEKKVFPYEKANEEYMKIAKPTFDSWVDRLPELEKSIEKGAEAATEAARKLADQAEKEEAERNAKALSDAQEAARNAAKAEELQAEFKSQIELQTGAIETKGRIKKRAVIEADTQDFVSVTSELFFNVFIHPKFSGIIKKDKKGVSQFNEDGTPIYVDWFQSLLDFYANNCDEVIPGIRIIEEVVTTQRAAR